MKYFIITIAVLISTLGVKSQTKIGPVFNEYLEDSFIFAKINEVRVNNGVTKLVPSGNLRKYVSQRNSSIMVKENRLFHPQLPKNKEFYNQIELIGKEYSKVNEGRPILYLHDTIPVFVVSEIAAKVSDNYLTYEELAERCVNGWLNSPPHKGIMLSENYNFRSKKLENILVGISTKKVNNYYYSCVNYIEF
jgi:uncharacterized protein YkwD